MEDNLTRLVDMFEEAEQSNLTSRDTALQCRDYYNGNQLTATELSELARRGQPPTVANQIRRKVDWLRGLEMQSRTDPRAFPRTPNEQEGAEAATDAIRYVCDNADWDKKRSACWSDMLVEGMAGVEVIHKFQPPMREPEIVINRYAYDRIFHDPHSSEPDFSDARYLGAVVWSDLKDLKRQYPGKEDVIDASLGPTDNSSDIFEDKPYHTVWSDPKRRRARCVLMYFRHEGQWHYAKFVKGGVLDRGVSPYVDENGEPLCPMIFASAYVDRENGRHGMVKDLLSVQDEINKRRSKLLHMLNSRQTWGPKGAVNSVRAMKRELASPDGHVEVTDEAVMNARESGVLPFNVIPTADQTMGQFNLLQENKAEMGNMGANSGLAGKDDESGQSGRAIMARQQGGMIEIAPLTDQLSQFTREVYRHIWLRVRQFWTEEKWIRVTDDETNLRFVGLNQPVTLQDALMEAPQEQVLDYARRSGLGPNDPRLMQVVGVRNKVAEMDVDILLEEVPDAVTLQGETFEQLVNLATSMPGSVPNEILIEAAPNLDRKVKDKLLEALEQQKAAQAEAGQMQAQTEMAKTQAEIERDRAAAMEDMANAARLQAEAVYPQVM